MICFYFILISVEDVTTIVHIVEDRAYGQCGVYFIDCSINDFLEEEGGGLNCRQLALDNFPIVITWRDWVET